MTAEERQSIGHYANRIRRLGGMDREDVLLVKGMVDGDYTAGEIRQLLDLIWVDMRIEGEAVVPHVREQFEEES